MKRRKNFIPLTIDGKKFLYTISGYTLIWYDENDKKFETKLDKVSRVPFLLFPP